MSGNVIKLAIPQTELQISIRQFIPQQKLSEGRRRRQCPIELEGYSKAGMTARNSSTLDNSNKHRPLAFHSNCDVILCDWRGCGLPLAMKFRRNRDQQVDRANKHRLSSKVSCKAFWGLKFARLPPAQVPYLAEHGRKGRFLEAKLRRGGPVMLALQSNRSNGGFGIAPNPVLPVMKQAKSGWR